MTQQSTPSLVATGTTLFAASRAGVDLQGVIVPLDGDILGNR